MKVCIFTGSRAEYGLLHPLIRKLKICPGVELRLIVTGTHLSPEFGTTVNQIEEQDLIESVEMLLSSDSPVGVAKSFGLGVIGMADVIARLHPDWCLIAGDRYEALACAATCSMLSVPIAHLHGGEITEGSLDEYFRHAITKLSRLHFTSTEVYRQRVIQMGEHPNTVFNVGAIGLDNLHTIDFLSRSELESDLQLKFREHNLLITYHPEHLDGIEELTNKFQSFLNDLATVDNTLFIFTKANADANGRVVNRILEDFVSIKPECSVLFDSLGIQRYFSLMKIVDAVVGNSSSGLLEAPSMGVPTINVGQRQKGRIKAASVIDCSEDEVSKSIKLCRTESFKDSAQLGISPYGDGHSADRIISTLLQFHISGSIKGFHDVKSEGIR